MRYYSGLWSSKGHDRYLWQGMTGRKKISKQTLGVLLDISDHEKIKVEKHCIISFNATIAG